MKTFYKTNKTRLDHLYECQAEVNRLKTKILSFVGTPCQNQFYPKHSNRLPKPYKKNSSKPKISSSRYPSSQFNPSQIAMFHQTLQLLQKSVLQNKRKAFSQKKQKNNCQGNVNSKISIKPYLKQSKSVRTLNSTRQSILPFGVKSIDKSNKSIRKPVSLKDSSIPKKLCLNSNNFNKEIKIVNYCNNDEDKAEEMLLDSPIFNNLTPKNITEDKFLHSNNSSLTLSFSNEQHNVQKQKFKNKFLLTSPISLKKQISFTHHQYDSPLTASKQIGLLKSKLKQQQQYRLKAQLQVMKLKYFAKKANHTCNSNLFLKQSPFTVNKKDCQCQKIKIQEDNQQSYVQETVISNESQQGSQLNKYFPLSTPKKNTNSLATKIKLDLSTNEKSSEKKVSKQFFYDFLENDKSVSRGSPSLDVELLKSICDETKEFIEEKIEPVTTKLYQENKIQRQKFAYTSQLWINRS